MKSNSVWRIIFFCIKQKHPDWSKMSEYIKKDPLIEIAEQQGYVTIDDIINEPPADVVHVRYGRWILQGRKILCSK